MEHKLKNAKGIKMVVIISCVIVAVLTLIVYFTLMLTTEK